MLKNYFVTAVRNLLKNKVTSFINVLGLAIGIACCVAILLYVMQEMSYDDYHPQAGQLYRVAIHNNPADLRQGIASASYPLAEAFLQEYPEVTQAARMGQLFEQDASVRIGDELFNEPLLYFADNNIFDLLTISFSKGNPSSALTSPNSVVLTEATAQKYFGETEVVGRTVVINYNNLSADYQITGVVKDAPPNSHFKFDLFASLDNIFVGLNPSFAQAVKSWYNYSFYTYIRLADGVSAAAFEPKLAQIKTKYFPPTRADVSLFLQPVQDIHLHSGLSNELQPNNDVRYVIIFSAIALLVLLIACINFMNLTTARSLSRAKEVGMRKLLGSQRSQLILQFLFEAMVTTAFAFLLAFGLIEMLSGALKGLIGLDLQINYLQISWMPLAIIFLIAVVGFLSGAYPAFFLSSFTPVTTLKGTFARSDRGAALRKILVVAQMTISIALMIGIVIISRQLSFIQSKKTGFDKTQMLMLKSIGTSFADPQVYQTFKDRLLQVPGVQSVTRNSRPLGTGLPLRAVYFDAVSDDKKLALPFLFAGHDVAKTYDLEMIAGRDFSKTFADTNFTYLVNESAVKQYHLEPALGRVIASGDNNSVSGRIVGVVRDFHFAPLHQPIEPMVIGLFDGGLPYITVKLRSENLSQLVDRIETIWRQHDSNRPMVYSFLDEQLDASYRFESQLGKIVTFFTLLAIFTASLGLFGMALHAAAQRTKEIGIRKALGATVSNIFLSFSFDFAKLVLFANVVAWPLAYFAMRRWLNDFAYRVDMTWWMFLLAGIVVLVIGLLTVSSQAIKASLANPVQSLRYE